MAEEPTEPSGLSGMLTTAATMAVLAVAATRVAAAPDREPAMAGTEHIASARPVLPEPASGVVGRIDALQRRKRPLAFAVGVIKKFGDDRGGRLAAVVAYYGFFSLFPAMLALVTVLGFVLEGRPDLRADIADSAIGQFPVIGDSISDAVSSPLSGSPIALVIGIAGALWAGMGAMQAAQDAMNIIWDVPRVEYPSFLLKRLRSLMLLGTIGLLLIGSAIVPQVIGAVSSGVLSEILLLAAAIALDIGVFLVAFKVLTVAHVRWHDLIPGACLAGTVYALLQLIGRVYITSTVNGAEDTYGTFAVVIGLLSWMFLVAQVTMIAAEVNVVAARGLWPRGLKRDSLTPEQ